jgi:hypothetical protein
MATDEIEIYVTRDGLGRAAIVRRTDGLFCIYCHGRGSGSWLEDDNPAFLRYEIRIPKKLQSRRLGYMEHSTMLEIRFGRRADLQMPS